MYDWREMLGKLVRTRGIDCFPLSVFNVMPPTGQAWPDMLPSCQGLRDFYELCDGGLLSLQYDWLPLSTVEIETAKWREALHGYHGDGKAVLIPYRHIVLATDSSGSPVIWDAESDRMASFYFKGGGWEPFELSFEEFLDALFSDSGRDAGDDLWIEALKQLSEMN